MNELNNLIKEQFGTKDVGDKLFWVLTDDLKNFGRNKLDENGCFLPDIMAYRITGNEKVDALITFKHCHPTRRVYAVFENLKEAKKIFPNMPIYQDDGKLIQARKPLRDISERPTVLGDLETVDCGL